MPEEQTRKILVMRIWAGHVPPFVLFHFVPFCWCQSFYYAFVCECVAVWKDIYTCSTIDTYNARNTYMHLTHTCYKCTWNLIFLKYCLKTEKEAFYKVKLKSHLLFQKFICHTSQQRSHLLLYLPHAGIAQPSTLSTIVVWCNPQKICGGCAQSSMSSSDSIFQGHSYL